MEESGPCPLCFKSFSYAQLPEHAATCTGESSSPDRSTSSSHHDADLELALRLQAEEEGRGTAAATTTSSSTAAAGQKRNYEDTLSADEEFARKLQEEEEARNRPQGVRCQICTEVTPMERLYILDECTHKFCKDCLKESVRVQVTKSATTVCPLQGCGAALSVRDMKDMMPTSSEIAPSGKGSQQATERLLQEFKAILKTKPEKQGYSVKPLKDNLYHWEVKFFDFDPKDPIGQDLARSKHKHILLHVTFPKTYPFNPPFIRVIRPRFAFRTGHVTIGGSICTELLTNSGWTPANTVESALVSIRANFIAGGARLDLSNNTDYNEAEAKEAFERMRREHGW